MARPLRINACFASAKFPESLRMGRTQLISGFEYPIELRERERRAKSWPFIYSLIPKEKEIRYENKLENKINLPVKSADLLSPVAKPP